MPRPSDPGAPTHAAVLAAILYALAGGSFPASAQPIGPPIIVQQQARSDNSLTSFRFHNLRNDRILAFHGIGTAAGTCPAFSDACRTTRAAIGDVTGDGDENLVATENTPFDHDRVAIYDQGGLLLDQFDLPNGEATMIAVVEVAADSRAEIVVDLNGQVQMFDADGNFLGGFALPPYDAIAAGDVDGDTFAEFVVQRGSTLQILEANGMVAATLELDPLIPAAFAIGDPDGDARNELLVVIQNVDVFESSEVRVLELPGGTEASRFTVLFENVLQIFTSDLIGDLAHEVLVVTSPEPTISDPDPTGADLVVLDGVGTVLASQISIFPEDFLDGSLVDRGPSWLIVGQKPYPDRDLDSLLDAWETTGIDVQGVTLDLPALGADPDHKDLFVELDWMADPSLPETGRGGRPTGGALGGFVGHTCDDGIDNDGKGGSDAADANCIDPRRLEETAGGCGDGLDNDGDTFADGDDSDCLVGDTSLSEGAAGPSNCGDGLDNDADGAVDTIDSDCRTLDTTQPEGRSSACADGRDNDGDGDVDGADGDCFDPDLDEAGPGSCGDGLDNNADGLIDANDPVCVTGGLTQSEIRRVAQAFCSAPGDAGPFSVPNPNGAPGIRLHLDVGGLRDGNGIESGIGPCSCGDGLDNDGNGSIDGSDPSCQVADPTANEGGGFGSCDNGADDDSDGLSDDDDPDCRVPDASLAETPIGPGSCADGLDNDADGSLDLADADCMVGDPLASDGGNLVPLANVCEVDDDFYDLKGDNFDASHFRGRIYRYGIATKCTSSGGQAEISGNDFVAANDDAGTLMHELGHTLGLRHGGNEDDNCKPNHVSVMNYDLQFGIPRRAGGAPNPGGTDAIYDFSPPRYPGGRGVAPLPELREDDLTESMPLDAGDRFNQSVFTNGTGLASLNLDGDNDGDRIPEGIDWDGDGAIESQPVQVNINSGSSACTSSSSDDRLSGHDNWRRINLSTIAECGLPGFDLDEIVEFLLGRCLNADGAVNPVEGPEPTLDDLLMQTRELNTSDLVLTLTADSDLVEVGDDVAFIHAIRNAGPDLVRRAAVDASVSERGSTASVPYGCVAVPGGLDCETGAIPRDRSRQLEVVVGTQNACIGGVPQPVVARANVSNAIDEAAPDPTPQNNAALLAVETQDTTPPRIACNTPATIDPTDAADEDEPAAAPISFTATAIDVCDGSPRVEIVDSDCFTLTKKGKRIDKTSSCAVAIQGPTITVVDSGGVGDQIEWTVRSADAAGNTVEGRCEVLVVNPAR